MWADGRTITSLMQHVRDNRSHWSQLGHARRAGVRYNFRFPEVFPEGYQTSR
jgi:hypothetical protein